MGVHAAHHGPVRLLHVLQEVAGVGGDRAGPCAPQQREQPALIDSPKVHRNVLAPKFPVRLKNHQKLKQMRDIFIKKQIKAKVITKFLFYVDVSLF